ncbi:isochorismate synthase [Flavobacterium sp.]|uniref:isochorismate synthase n=1 Tax=Flavobacterium sp. TaxID=239 RepID=UPI0028BE7357|nr:isochorismate synthase [Flavobacterium sp.]
MEELFEMMHSHLELKLPFVLFSKPGKRYVTGLFQENDILHFVHTFQERGFVFAPFSSNQIVLFPEEQQKVMIAEFTLEKKTQQSNVFYEIDDEAKVSFENLVSRAISEISIGNFQKVVLSRKETLDLNGFEVQSVFERMLQAYPSAFKYCFYHPKVGMWMGASPEQLLKVTNSELQTVALAGTKVDKGKENVNWKDKEKKEQQFVTDFIVENLKKHVAETAVSEPYTVQAGSLLHIKTDISAKLPEATNVLQSVLEILHPTPAVCGYPKQKAKDFILANEGYNREYYAGFFGEFNMNFISKKGNYADLFVNLRCMKVEPSENKAHLYIGCGITEESNPSKEFLETVNKSMTIKKILN